MAEYLRATAERDPAGLALREPASGREVTWADYDEAVDRAARALISRGLVAGQRVAILMVNSIDMAVALYAAMRSGIVAVPVNPRSSGADLAFVLSDASPKLLLVDDVTRPLAGEAELPETLAVAGLTELVESGGDAELAAPLDAEAAAAILYTSTASGASRGAILSHRALIANLDQVSHLARPAVVSGDRLLGVLPLSHIYGLNAILGQCVVQGATLVLVTSFDPEAVLQLVVNEGLTNLPVAPPIIAAWANRRGLREALQHVRVVVSGAAALDRDLLDDFESSSGHRVEQGYGLTEGAPVVTSTFAVDEADVERGSVGQPIPGVDVQLRDHDGGVAELGDPAQMWVKGPNLFSGFWPDGSGGPDDDGWYATGEVAIQSESAISLVDRVQELISVSGFNVYPSEVEDIIGQLPSVAQVAVVGIPDKSVGEKVVAFVVPTSGDSDTDELAAEITTHCRERIARFKVPSVVQVVADLPHSATGEVHKGRLRALARGVELNL